MASLQNEQIDQSYQGLIKTADNTATIPFPPAKLQFGDGTDFPIEIGDLSQFGEGTFIALKSGTGGIQLDGNSFAITSSAGTISPTGGTVDLIDGTFNFGAGFPGAPATNVDFTNATVTGLPGGAAGLENGSGADSLQSAASLTTTAANASDSGSIALGNGAISSGNNGNAIGANSECKALSGTAIGNNSQAGNSAGEFYSIAIGNGCKAGDSSVVIGNSINGLTTAHAVGIGNTGSIAFRSIAIGRLAGATGSASVSIGNESDATATNSVALGNGVQATTANTATVNLLQIAGYAGMNYADDAAAATGGIPLGGVYHTSGALKIRIA